MLIALGASAIALSFFCPRDPEHWKVLQNSFSEKILQLETNLDAIEGKLRGQQLGTAISDQTSQPPETLEEINKRFQASLEKLAFVESRIEKLINKKIGSVPIPPNMIVPPLPGSNIDPTVWIAELPKSKRSQVEEIFKQHHDFFKKNLLSGSPPNPEKLRAIMEESDQILREKLKDVLDEKEYQKFLQSLPKPPNAQLGPLPNAPK
jgi:hypothetical protein